MNMNIIQNIYSQELRLPDLNPSDDFFEVGGNSLVMAAIQVRILEELNLEVSMDTLFRNSSVESLGSALMAQIQN